jgi:DNA-binding NarL/FixJ family response regulator
VTSAALRHRAASQIERLCASTLDERALRAEVLAALRPAVGFDAHVFLLADPATTVGHSPHAEVPCLPRLPEAIRLKYLTQVNRWTSLLRRQVPVDRLHRATGGELSRSPMWRELLRDFGISDVLSAVFADRHGCWGFLDLWRTGEPFGDDEAALLAEVAPTVCRALRERQAAAFTMPATGAAVRNGPAVILLDEQLQITGRTSAATDWLRTLLPTAPQQSPIPAAVYNVAAQLLAVRAGVDDHEPSARSTVAGSTWVTLRASRLEQRDSGEQDGIAVSIEEASAGLRLDLFARCFGLSTRERQLLELLGRGADTRDIAVEMSISDYTVQDHLKSVFTKTSLTSRGALITTALGPRATVPGLAPPQDVVVGKHSQGVRAGA